MLNKILLVGLAVLLVVATTLPASAASEDECAIWLCITTGFNAEGCDPAHRAFHTRIAHNKPPVPGFGECSDDEGGVADEGRAAFVPTRTICTQWDYGDDKGDGGCLAWQTIPEHFVKDQRCQRGREEENEPAGCTRTVRYVDIMIDGVSVGEPYYY